VCQQARGTEDKPQKWSGPDGTLLALRLSEWLGRTAIFCRETVRPPRRTCNGTPNAARKGEQKSALLRDTYAWKTPRHWLQWWRKVKRISRLQMR
jgi:hypothetical protein